MEHRYSLEKYKGIKTRHTCPACGHKHEFARYVDAEGNYLFDHVGRCNRQSKCGYWLTAKQYLRDNPTAVKQSHKQPIPQVPKKIEYISPDILQATLKAYDKNSFVIYLHTLFDSETVQRLVDTYGLGTTKDGSCIFWQVDDKCNVRTGQATRYSENGHRIKGTNRFVHTKLGVKNVEQCLFGLHLLVIGDQLPIGLVESEKTAVIMAGKLPAYIWMATSGIQNTSKAYALRGRKVVAFPDGDAYLEWTDSLAPYGFRVSSALQKYLTEDEQEEGKDLADFVNRARNYFETLKDGTAIQMDPAGYPASWNASTWTKQNQL